RDHHVGLRAPVRDRGRRRLGSRRHDDDRSFGRGVRGRLHGRVRREAQQRGQGQSDRRHAARLAPRRGLVATAPRRCCVGRPGALRLCRHRRQCDSSGMGERPDLSRNTWLRPAAVLGSMLPTVIVGSSCQPGDEGVFRITRVEFDGNWTITLRFSKLLAPIDEVDANDFRLSFAMTTSYTYSYEGMTNLYEYTSYDDLSYVLGGRYYVPGPFTIV